MQLPEPPRIWQDKDVIITTSTTPSASGSSDGASMVDQPTSSSTTPVTSQHENAYFVSETTSRSLAYQEEVLGPMVNAEDLPTPSPSPPNGMPLAHSHAATPVGPLIADTLADGNGDASSPTVKLGLPLRKRSKIKGAFVRVPD